MTFIKNPYVLAFLLSNVIAAYYIISYFGRSSSIMRGREGGLKNRSSSPRSIPKSDLPYREYTLGELRQFDNNKNSSYILVAIGNRVYDVSSAPQFYGSNGGYAAFAGRDASQSLANNRVIKYPENHIQDYDNFINLNTAEHDRLNGWISYFDVKYHQVGTVVSSHMWAGSDQEEGQVGLDRGALLDHIEFDN